MLGKLNHSRTRKSTTNKFHCAGFAVFFLAVSLVRVEACPVCFLLPSKTAADLLIEGEFVVLARENPQRPFSFSAIEILKGQVSNEEFGLFVDSGTRRRLKANPEYAVVLVRNKNDESWQSLGVADSQFQEVVKRILAFSEQWAGEGGSSVRYKFFMPLLENKNRTIFELAYLELGRAPYSTIKKMANYVSRDDLHRVLRRREYFEWRSLAILLLAQNPGEQDRKQIERSFGSCHKFSLTTNLAAWTTAYVELKGTNVLNEIEEIYFRDSSRSVAEIRAVILALSVHGLHGPTQFRDRIVESYGVALQNHPRVAGQIVNDLAEWNLRAHSKQIATIIKNSKFAFDEVETEAIKSYLGSVGVADSR